MSDFEKDFINYNDRGEIVEAHAILGDYHVSILGQRLMVTYVNDTGWYSYCNVWPVEDFSLTTGKLCKFLDMDFKNPCWREIRDFIVAHLDFATSLYYKGKKNGK